MSRVRPLLTVALLALAVLFGAAPAAAQSWPRATAPNVIQISKEVGLEDPGGLPDSQWIHLHRGHHTAPDAVQATLRVRLFADNSVYNETPILGSGLTQVRFLVHGVDVSGWLALASNDFTWVLHIDNAGLNGLLDGIHDISVEVNGPARNDYMPAPIFVHITRGRAVSPDVPIMGASVGSMILDAGPYVQYVRAADRHFRAYPLAPEVEPFHDPPYAANLFGELMSANAEWSTTAQMWWEELPHNLPFVRAIAPKHANDDHRELRVTGLQERMPFKDGGRGVGWVGSLITGQIDSQGRFAFAEAGGRVGYLLPTGEIVTVAGWRTRLDKDPVWITKSMTQIRGNQELRGVWLEGAYPGESGGFRTPLDIAIDPQNENIWYVAAYEDHCIWKVVVDPTTRVGTVTVFAGDPNHTRGSSNGQGHAARFSGPTSVVFDPVCDCLYVSDQDQHLIRRISRGGLVTTLFGRTDMVSVLASRGVTDRFNRDQVRPAMQLEVSASQAAGGTRPDIYVPMTVRVDSAGRLLTLGLGDGMIRRIDPSTGVTKIMGRVDSKFEEFAFGWAWMDVDRWGNTGPKDGIYWCKSVGGDLDGEDSDRFNEVYAWLPPEGGLSRFVFGDDWDPHPNGWGDRDAMGPPHYAWLVAVDPRGALLIAGMGEHGITRVRARRSTDRAPDELYPRYYEGQTQWRLGAPNGDAPSFTFKFGWDGHNYLGFPDAWGLTGAETDQQLFDLFGAPASLRQDAEASNFWLYALRNNRGSSGGAVPPQNAYTRYFAEGSTGTFFDTRFAILNPDSAATTATLNFQRDDGTVVTETLNVPGRTRLTLWPRTISGLDRATFSTVIASPQPLVVDRTMTWPANGSGYGSHAETSLPGPSTTWYLAEGATSDPFDVFYLLQNPNSSSVIVTVTYLRPAPLPTLEKSYALGANSRMNIWVDQEELPTGSGQYPLAFGDVSARISATQPIVVERAMYFSRAGQPFAAGHASAGVTAPSASWFFAEGATGSFFDLFILLANPNDQDASVEARYLRPDGSVLTKTYAVAANSRYTIWVDDETFGAAGKALADTAVSTTITSTNGVPILAERSMWWPQTGWYEAHNSPGATTTGTRWALAEGEAGGTDNAQTYVLIANTSTTAASVRVTLLFEDGTSAERTFTVGANSRFNVDVAAEFTNVAGRRFGAIVESLGASPAPIVVERAMYSSADGVLWSAGTNALATRLQ